MTSASNFNSVGSEKRRRASQSENTIAHALSASSQCRSTSTRASRLASRSGSATATSSCPASPAKTCEAQRHQGEQVQVQRILREGRCRTSGPEGGAGADPGARVGAGPRGTRAGEEDSGARGSSQPPPQPHPVFQNIPGTSLWAYPARFGSLNPGFAVQSKVRLCRMSKTCFLCFFEKWFCLNCAPGSFLYLKPADHQSTGKRMLVGIFVFRQEMQFPHSHQGPKVGSFPFCPGRALWKLRYMTRPVWNGPHKGVRVLQFLRPTICCVINTKYCRYH